MCQKSLRFKSLQGQVYMESSIVCKDQLGRPTSSGTFSSKTGVVNGPLLISFFPSKFFRISILFLLRLVSSRPRPFYSSSTSPPSGFGYKVCVYFLLVPSYHPLLSPLTSSKVTQRDRLGGSMVRVGSGVVYRVSL